MAVIATFLSPPAIAKQLRVSRDTVLGWIRSGELTAVDLASPGSTRPRYRIDQADLRAFLLRRQVQTTPKQKRRRRKNPAIREYF